MSLVRTERNSEPAPHLRGRSQAVHDTATGFLTADIEESDLALPFKKYVGIQTPPHHSDSVGLTPLTYRVRLADHGRSSVRNRIYGREHLDQIMSTLCCRMSTGLNYCRKTKKSLADSRTEAWGRKSAFRTPPPQRWWLSFTSKVQSRASRPSDRSKSRERGRSPTTRS